MFQINGPWKKDIQYFSKKFMPDFGQNGWKHETYSAKYKIDDFNFFIDSKADKCKLSKWARDNVITYSRQNNNIVHIIQLENDKAITQFYPHLNPLLIHGDNNFLNEEDFEKQSNRYISLLLNTKKAEYLFKRSLEV